MRFTIHLLKLQHKGGIPSVCSGAKQADSPAGELHYLAGKRQTDTASLFLGSEEGDKDFFGFIVGDYRTVIAYVDKDVFVCRCVGTDVNATFCRPYGLDGIFIRLISSWRIRFGSA